MPAGRKFHIRAYVLAVGALSVYLFDDALALFADAAYTPPSVDVDDLAAALTNTCLQDAADEADRNVRLTSDLVGCRQAGSSAVLTAADVDAIRDQIADVVAETFRAALGTGSHFQPLPNAFELYGVDLLVDADRQVHLLEVNAVRPLMHRPS